MGSRCDRCSRSSAARSSAWPAVQPQLGAGSLERCPSTLNSNSGNSSSQPGSSQPTLGAGLQALSTQFVSLSAHLRRLPVSLTLAWIGGGAALPGKATVPHNAMGGSGLRCAPAALAAGGRVTASARPAYSSGRRQRRQRQAAAAGGTKQACTRHAPRTYHCQSG